MKHSLNNDHITVTKKCTPGVSRKEYRWLSFHASHGNEVLRFSYKDHLTNVEVLAKIQQAVGPHEDRMTVIKKRKTAVVWTRLPFIGSGQNHLARHSERGGGWGEGDKADGRRGGKTTSGNGQAWSSPSPRGKRRTLINGGN